MTTASSLAPLPGATTIAAFDLGSSSGSLGGVDFSSAPTSQVTTSNGITVAYSVPGQFWATNASGAYGQNAVLNSFLYTNPTNAGLIEVGGLSSGQQYTLQFIAADSRVGPDGRVYQIVGGANAGADVTGTSAQWRYAYQGLEQYGVISATFTADASGKVAFYSRNYSSDGTTAQGTQLNALHIMAVPEPSIALLGGVGLLCLLRRKRD